MIAKTIRSVILLPFLLALWPLALLIAAIGLVWKTICWIITGSMRMNGVQAPTTDELLHILLFPYSFIKNIYSKK